MRLIDIDFYWNSSLSDQERKFFNFCDEIISATSDSLFIRKSSFESRKKFH